MADHPDAVARLAADAADVRELDARVSVCRACPRLVSWRSKVAETKRAAFAGQPYWGRPLPGFGDDTPRLLIVGLAPAAHGGNRTGRIFTGDRSGDWLYAALHRAGYAAQAASVHAGDGQELRSARIVAAVRCAPPQNRPSTAEKVACAPWLDREFALVEPTLEAILALGSIGWDAVVATSRRVGWTVPRPRPRFGHLAAAELATGKGRPVRLVGSYHVSQQNTFTGKLTEPMLDAAVALAGFGTLRSPP